MNAKEQRIAIAEACGWKRKVETTLILAIERTTWTSPNGKISYPPDYLNDLNAMHEAESMGLIGHHQFAFNAKLFLVAASINLSAGVNRPESIWKVLHATAAQRAEAFLKTLGLWRETPNEKASQGE